MKINFVQIAIIAAAIILVIVVLGIFTGVIPGLGGDTRMEQTTETSIWIPESRYEEFSAVIKDDFSKEKKNIKVSILSVPDGEYMGKIINALAANSAPEVWFLSHDLLLTHKDKVATLPFSSLSERTFIDSFIDSSEIFLNRVPEERADEEVGGSLGIPVSADPIVLYRNKDFFSSAGLALPPKTWDEFVSYAETLTKKDGAGNIVIGGAALGEFSNIKHAKEILALLILQTGNKIIDQTTFEVRMGERGDLPIDPAASAIRFFNQFSDPRKTTYSWNFTFPEALDAFAAQKLAMYLGYASEYELIRAKNPHLNFDIAEVPQIRDVPAASTHGRLRALVFSKKAVLSSAAFELVKYLSSYDAQKKLTEMSLIPSVRRDVLAERADDPALAVFNKSAVKMRVWPDPNPRGTYDIFKNMVESVKTGKKDLTKAVQDAKIQIQQFIPGK